jgi:SAM-dependent methyltransferase
MRIDDAVELIRDAIGDSAGVWADLGAGTGTFTRALARTLGAGSTIYAVDDDARVVSALRELQQVGERRRIVAVRADFSRPFELPGLGNALLDGILLANALHFVRDAEKVLNQLVTRVRVGGRVVIVEYDRRAASPWVPYPIRASQWPRLAEAAGLIGARVTATRPSAYEGEIYAAVGFTNVSS